MKETALHWASKRGYSKIMHLLLEYGADPNAKDMVLIFEALINEQAGRTPLFLAAMGSKVIPVKVIYFNRRVLSVQLLISYGADPTIRSEGRKFASDYAWDPFVRLTIIKGYKVK